MTKDDLIALPVAIRSFNGFYTVRGKFTMENSIHMLIALGVLILAAVVVLVWLLARYFRRRQTRSQAAHERPSLTALSKKL